MIIATANGLQALTIPTTHDTSMLMKDIRISDHANWRHVHWNALASAYGESPFFPYYQDDIRPTLYITEHYIPRDTMSADLVDYRDAIRPKHPLPDEDFVPRRYYQVYEHKHGFQPNLSILDLLFNEGNESILYLI